jgi:microcystin degradation protein MlrC
MADTTGGGAPGDSTELLRTFLDLQLPDALLLYLVDPEAARQAHAAGVGQRIKVDLGGKSNPIQGPPIPLEVEVLALSDGRFTYDGPMYAGLTGDLGLSAWLRHGGVNVVVVSGRMQPHRATLVLTYPELPGRTAGIIPAVSRQRVGCR